MRFITTLFILGLSFFSSATALATENQQKKPAGPPPMLVEVAPIAEGDAEALVERVGTVRYARVSRVATEVSGIVEELFFTEGTRVKAGQSMR